MYVSYTFPEAELVKAALK